MVCGRGRRHARGLVGAFRIKSSDAQNFSKVGASLPRKESCNFFALRASRAVGGEGRLRGATMFAIRTRLALALSPCLHTDHRCRASLSARALLERITLCREAATGRSASSLGWRAVWPPKVLRHRSLRSERIVMCREDGDDRDKKANFPGHTLSTRFANSSMTSRIEHALSSVSAPQLPSGRRKETRVCHAQKSPYVTTMRPRHWLGERVQALMQDFSLSICACDCLDGACYMHSRSREELALYSEGH